MDNLWIYNFFKSVFPDDSKVQILPFFLCCRPWIKNGEKFRQQSGKRQNWNFMVLGSSFQQAHSWLYTMYNSTNSDLNQDLPNDCLPKISWNNTRNKNLSYLSHKMKPLSLIVGTVCCGFICKLKEKVKTKFTQEYSFFLVAIPHGNL